MRIMYCKWRSSPFWTLILTFWKDKLWGNFMLLTWYYPNSVSLGFDDANISFYDIIVDNLMTHNPIGIVPKWIASSFFQLWCIMKETKIHSNKNQFPGYRIHCFLSHLQLIFFSGISGTGNKKEFEWCIYNFATLTA